MTIFSMIGMTGKLAEEKFLNFIRCMGLRIRQLRREMPDGIFISENWKTRSSVNICGH